MDPLSALSLACNVIQLVEWSIEGARTCKELCDNGSLDDNNRVEKYTLEVAAANKEVQTALQSAKSSGGTTRVQRIAQDASSTANELKIVLNRLKLSKSQGIKKIGGAFKTTLKTLISSGTIKKLQQRLELQEKALRSTILKDL
ncbi:uncharacterized protein HMPREF1541_05627 [Cyphellophora europaea CBS 101466]|uniref:Fungal N-terminal domain-containing protein n=1 Tax=Cyphellophora europaea (strain CBS 101466) TaxID=1220924 RepID=W2RUP0_CYPE1|nr:uncharacterized protein HMPREF1541_05627 [Cyphellophora europaea CBS 101466]ETN39404.1 hypothetical protein HMPREF1541_05627 [Cyphellophora europaea CBS 101466]